MSREQKLEAALRNLLAYHIAPTNGQTPFAKAINEARQALAEPDDEWISVKTRLPEESQPGKRNIVLVWMFTVGEWAVEFGEISCGHWRPRGGNGNFDDRVTHWMPLPAPPKPETK